jgi:hypothetical protein
MPTRLVLRGVLHSFLQTLTSRNSDYRRYWLWGLVVDGLGELSIDLLGAPDPSDNPFGAAHRRAVVAFAQQVGRVGLVSSRVAQASVRVSRLSEPTEGVVNGLRRAGFRLRFEVVAVTDTGRRFEAARTVFAAPHYSNGEYRSTRHAEPGAAADGGA